MEQAKRSANDVTHLSDELRQQNDRNATLEKQRRLHEAQIKELQVGRVESHIVTGPPTHSVLGPVLFCSPCVCRRRRLSASVTLHTAQRNSPGGSTRRASSVTYRLGDTLFSDENYAIATVCLKIEIHKDHELHSNATSAKYRNPQNPTVRNQHWQSTNLQA